ncbi:MAG TPA: glycosyltransferase family 2 protein [Cerasibacillus sp.]|uniref:glycosyltransferase family 2 protein n=1 Tax=Cerasibacillus sp. TaxID=2498711 RepID=UPI002F41B445
MKEKQQELISVITPAYNAERFIGETIESVLNQTYPHWEMVIVDDCSTDKTVDMIKTYQQKDQRVKLIQLEENSGAAVARNTAMAHAKGRYIAFLDSDDLWTEDKLEKQLAFMQEKDIAFSFTRYTRMQEDGTMTNAVSDAPHHVDYDDLMKHCVIGCLTVMLDREKIGDLKMMNIRTRQDYVYWLTITKKGHLAYGMPDTLAKYRLVEGSISSNKWKAAKRNWYVYRHIEKQSLLKSIWYFANYAFTSVKNLIKYKLMK